MNGLGYALLMPYFGTFDLHSLLFQQSSGVNFVYGLLFKEHCALLCECFLCFYGVQRLRDMKQNINASAFVKARAFEINKCKCKSTCL